MTLLTAAGVNHGEDDGEDEDDGDGDDAQNDPHRRTTTKTDKRHIYTILLTISCWPYWSPSCLFTVIFRWHF